MNTVKVLACTLGFLFSTTTIAETIRWELSGASNIYVPDLTGGFDYNTEGGDISNVTLRTYISEMPSHECFLCIDATGYEGTVSETGVSFYREFFRDGNHAGYFLIDISDTGFSVAQPGTSTLHFSVQRHSYHPDDPAADILEQVHCGNCVVAIGRIITTPIPEPETYGMLIAGLGIFGWWGRHKKTDHPLHQAA